jgi:hypothetical protein
MVLRSRGRTERSQQDSGKYHGTADKPTYRELRLTSWRAKLSQSAAQINAALYSDSTHDCSPRLTH